MAQCNACTGHRLLWCLTRWLPMDLGYTHPLSPLLMLILKETSDDGLLLGNHVTISQQRRRQQPREVSL